MRSIMFPGKRTWLWSELLFARGLRPGGYFYFDVNNSLAFEKIWPGTWWIEKPGLALVMRGGYDSARDKGWTKAEWFIRGHCCWRRYRENIEQIA